MERERNANDAARSASFTQEVVGSEQCAGPADMPGPADLASEQHEHGARAECE